MNLALDNLPPMREYNRCYKSIAMACGHKHAHIIIKKGGKYAG